MFQIVGIVLLFVMVFGSYLMSHGKLAVIIEAVPHELMAIGGALVGTFLGVFLAYGIVGPMATRLKNVVDEEGAFYRIIQSVLVAHLHGNAAQISVEIGRGNVPSTAQPSFGEMEETLNNIPAEAA